MTDEELRRMEQPDLIKLIDSGELAIVKHGEWEFICMDDTFGIEIFQCTNCKCQHLVTTQYCECCGSRMDGGKENG